MMTDGGRVRVRYAGGVAEVTLNRPEKHNGVDVAMLRGVLAAQREVKSRREVRAVLLRGEGPSFCAGLDFKSVLAKPVTAALMASQLLWPIKNQFQAWSMGFRRIGVPVIALVHGNCFGAGLQLALGADLRIATPDAKLSLLEAKWGLVPDMGGPTLLRELVRVDVAKELTMTGRVVSGVEGQRLGLVTHVTEDPESQARGLIAEIEARSPDAVAAGKFLLQDAWGASEPGALGAERRWQRRVMAGGNQRIAMRRNEGGGAATDTARAPFTPRRFG